MSQRDQFESQLVERAQRDPEFRARLLADAAAAVAEELAVEIPAGLSIRVIEEQPGEAVLVLPATVPGGEVPEAELADVAGGTGGSWCGNSHCTMFCCQWTAGGCG